MRERVPAMANPHKSLRERERVGVKQKYISPEGSELKKLRVCGNGIFFNYGNYGENLRETKNFCWWAREREISHTKT